MSFHIGRLSSTHRDTPSPVSSVDTTNPLIDPDLASPNPAESTYAPSVDTLDLYNESQICSLKEHSGLSKSRTTETLLSSHPRFNSEVLAESARVGSLSSKAADAASADRRHSKYDKPQGKCFGRIKNKVYAHFDPRSVLHLFDFRPWFYPFTPKKYFVLTIIAGIIAGIIVSNYYTHWITKSLQITRSYMLPVLVISVCAEPLIILIILPVAKFPEIPNEQIKLVTGRGGDIEGVMDEKFRAPQGPFETALVIPCHDTDHAAMRTTIHSALPHFRPEDIYIIDNGRTKYPSHPEGNFREYIRSIHPDIVYMWSPIGSKNASQFVGALAARNRGYKYIMTVDDDVCIPKNFEAPVSMIDDKFKAVAFPIKAMDAQCNVPLWLVAWQDVEYRLSGMSKLAEDRLCGVQFPHGAGWFVELESFIPLMEHYHPMDFVAEDCNAGLGLSRMGKGLRLDARCYLATEVPTTFFGPGLSWWKQRQKSWEMGRHGRLFAFIRHFLVSLPPKKTIQGIIWHKLTFFYLICTILIDWLRIPTIIALGRTPTWWRNAFLLMLFSSVAPLAYNYWKCRRRPDMKTRFWACVTYPFYKLIYVAVAICGAVRYVGYFLGGHQTPPTIQEMLKHGDERCFWLDPKFKNNPAWLADEGAVEEAERSDKERNERNEEPEGISPLSPPTPTYSSSLSPSVDYSLPQPPCSNTMPRPRGSPDIGAMVYSKTPTVPSGQPSSLSISTLSNPIDGQNPFVDPDMTGSQ